MGKSLIGFNSFTLKVLVSYFCGGGRKMETLYRLKRRNNEIKKLQKKMQEKHSRRRRHQQQLLLQKRRLSKDSLKRIFRIEKLLQVADEEIEKQQRRLQRIDELLYKEDLECIFSTTTSPSSSFELKSKSSLSSSSTSSLLSQLSSYSSSFLL